MSTIERTPLPPSERGKDPNDRRGDPTLIGDLMKPGEPVQAKIRRNGGKDRVAQLCAKDEAYKTRTGGNGDKPPPGEYSDYPEAGGGADGAHGDNGAAGPAVVEDEKPKFEPFTIGAGFLDDVAAMPRRKWIIPKHLLRGYVSVTTAPGGVGKSLFSLVKAIGVAIGRDLLDLGQKKQCNVLVINNEDDEDEMKRRIAGICVLYGIAPADLTGKFFWFTGYGDSLIIAQEVKMDAIATVVPGPLVEPMLDFCKENDIGAIFIDPFISTHNVLENDNTGMQKVTDQYKRVAHESGAAVELVHHTKKMGGDSEAHAGNMEASRGASSVLNAARCHVTVARMSDATAEQIDMSPEEAVRHLRMDDTGKQNFELPDPAARWFRLESVDIPNGDQVGVPEPVDLSGRFEYATRSDKRVKWTAAIVSETLYELMDNATEMAWGFLRDRFMEKHGISEASAKRAIKKLPVEGQTPMRIKVGAEYFEFWISRAGTHVSAPIMVHQRFL